MSIYPDKKNGVVTGRWRVEVQLGGLRKRGRFDAHKEAQEAERKWTEELASGEATDATPRTDQTPPTVLRLLAKAAPLLWNGSEHGQLSEKKVRWIAEHCGDILLARLTTNYIDKTILTLRTAGKSSATINRYLSALHAVLGWGAKPGRRYVPIMPEFQWKDEDEGRIRYLTPDEEQRLIGTLRALGFDEIADLCIVAVDTGCRRSELLTAQRHQLDGKWLRLWRTKTGKAGSVAVWARISSETWAYRIVVCMT
ncbi:MAG TPA: hypothetical protein VFR68_07915 [Candidatus Dormibacteraeota bacterium]|nr:hypothetical protein [Candidatus Dormibacteraeota bacterium]